MCGKKVVAVPPYSWRKFHFKMYPYNAWINIGGNVCPSHYPAKLFRGFIYRVDIPELFFNKKEARLKFVEVNSVRFDSFPDYIFYEIIPFIWDCWPLLDCKLIRWLKRHNVKSCVFTSSEAASRIKKVLPHLNVLVVSEGIDTSLFSQGESLRDRKIDLYSYGRLKKELYENETAGIVSERGGARDLFLYRLQNAKITIALPQCDVLPERTGGQETLTQRFWECMLSRTVLLGRAPKELIDLIGYNPVIDIDYENYIEQVKDISSHIENYQELVDRNRETALRMAPWEIRMKQVMEWLTSLGYEV